MEKALPPFPDFGGKLRAAYFFSGPLDTARVNKAPMPAYAEAKMGIVRNVLDDICAKDDPEAHRLARQFAAEIGITDQITIARMAWMMIGYSKRQSPKNAKKRAQNPPAATGTG